MVLQAGSPLASSSRHQLNTIDHVELGRGAAARAVRDIDAGVRRLRVAVADSFCSTQHAVIKRQGHRCFISDAGSRNGTRVNNVAVTDAVELRAGDRIEIGATQLLFDGPVAVGAAPDVELFDTGADGLSTLSPALERDLDVLGRVGASAVNILVAGPTGAGKEVVARAVHRLSRRAGEFVAVNCGALPDELVEAELFGHKRGAFSGATDNRLGLVAAADNGTLFLDELGDLPMSAQAALLRVLQEREVRPVGGHQPVAVDIRLIGATHRNLEELVAAGTFRQDLYHRVTGHTIALPALAERRMDLGLFVSTFLGRLAPGESVSFDDDAARGLLAHAWPGNARQLQTTLATGLARRTQSQIAAVDLALTDAAEPAPALADEPEVRAAQLRALLIEHRGNVSGIARALGKARSQVQRWLKRYDLHADEFRDELD